MNEPLNRDAERLRSLRRIKFAATMLLVTTAALFVVAAALGVRCGSCFHAVWNQEREKAGLAMPMTEDTTGAVKVGIEAMKRIITADLESGK